MPTAQDVLNLARSQLGVSEPHDPYNEWYYGHPVDDRNYAWCSVFVSWLFWKSGAENLIHGRSAYSGDILNRGRAAGEEVSIQQAQPGDVVIFDWGDAGITDHIGIVEARLGPTTFQTLEGNSGDMVKRNQRTLSSKCVMWFVRPKYGTVLKEEDDMGLAQIQQSIAAGGIFETAGLVQASRKAVVYLDLLNQGQVAANVNVKIQKSNGDFGEKAFAVPISTGAAGKVSQGLKALEIGQVFGDVNLGNILIWVSSDQPTIIIKSQTLV